MKRIKKVISLFLTVSLIVGILTNLTGCSSKESYITMGDWLSLINSTFHMDSYSSDTPYFTNITSDNPYFKEIQIAGDWGVVDTTASDIDVNQKITYKTACITLVNTSEICDSTASEDEKIDVAQNSFLLIKDYFLDKNIKLDEAKKAVDDAYFLWADKKYDGVTEKVEYLDEIIDLTNDSKAKDFTINEDMLIVPTDNTSLKVGDTFVLPANGSNITVSAYKAKSVEYVNGMAYIEKEGDVELTDVIEQLQVAETYTPTLDKSIVYDGNGNLVYSAGKATQTDNTTSAKTKSSNLLAIKDSNGGFIECVEGSSAKSTFKTDDCEVSFEYNGSGVKASVKMPFYTSADKQTKLNGTASIKISDINVTNKIDFSWFTLHSAIVKVDYKTETSFGVSLQHSNIDKVYAPKYSNGNGKFISNLKRSLWKDTNGKGAKTIKICKINVASIGLASLCLDVSVKVTVEGSISVIITESGSKGIEYKGGNLRLINVCDKDTDVQLKGKLEGILAVGPSLYALGLKKPIIGVAAQIGLGAEASVTLHLSDTENHLLEENTSADLPPEMYQDLQAYDLVGDAQAIIDLAESQGCTYTTVTSGDVKLHSDVCIDITAYFILRVGLEDTSLVGSLISGKIKTTWEIFGKNNSKLCNIHFDNFNWSQGLSNIAWGGKSPCSLKYKPFDTVVTSASSTIAANSIGSSTGSASTNVAGSNDGSSNSVAQNNNKIFSGKNLEISTMEITTSLGKSENLSVTGLPDGYSQSDVVFQSEDPSIVTVDSNGNITAKTAGITAVSVSVANGMISVTCAVNVVSDEIINFSPISSQYMETK